MTNAGLGLLPQHLGRPALSGTGSQLARVTDLTVRLDSPYPGVHRLLVRRYPHRSAYCHAKGSIPHRRSARSGCWPRPQQT
jgi:hypothetical protein